MYNDVKRNRKQKIGKHETEWKKNAVNFIFSRFLFLLWSLSDSTGNLKGYRGHDRMIVGLTTTYVISVYHH